MPLKMFRQPPEQHAETAIVDARADSESPLLSEIDFVACHRLHNLLLYVHPLPDELRESTQDSSSLEPH